MLQKVCNDEGIELVNVVRRPEHVELLQRDWRALRLRHELRTAFEDDLISSALTETGATLAFDATGGGPLANQLLSMAWKLAAKDQGSGIQSIRIERAQAGLHLRRPRYLSDRACIAATAWPGGWAVGC